MEKLRWSEKKFEVPREQFQEIVADSIKQVEAEGIDMGKGRTAKVMRLPGYPDVCMKRITDRRISKNRAHKEMEFLDTMCGRRFSVPQPVCSIEDNEIDYLFMKTIRGFSVESLIKDDRVKELSDQFDFKKFFTEVRAAVEQMHELRIFHRDLHWGNIMIDNLGKPVIIDFGDAAYNYISSESPYRDTNPKGELVIYSTDEDSVSKVYKQLGAYLREKGFFATAKK